MNHLCTSGHFRTDIDNWSDPCRTTTPEFFRKCLKYSKLDTELQVIEAISSTLKREEKS